MCLNANKSECFQSKLGDFRSHYDSNGISCSHKVCIVKMYILYDDGEVSMASVFFLFIKSFPYRIVPHSFRIAFEEIYIFLYLDIRTRESFSELSRRHLSLP